ncbi:SoxR reducing system RseC family protein [Feifania hominis]|uniref:SoxR reducing system RseC family protein n=1 Tax=Feifania hominis TaxID=2763660 RepID=A0A926DAZ4_9FIRM|nr:SoxR reducing system RseC family protein [Feifania hominis]MBC8535163.1 SoxR reducing system RseC family protein [Feifania hominis]
MERRGRVLSVQGEIARVVVYQQSACGDGCAGGCGMCAAAPDLTMEVHNTAQAAPGDEVLVELAGRPVAALAALLYLLPLALGFAGYFFAAALGAGEGLSALAALAALVLGFVPAVLVSRNMSEKPGRVLSVLSKE